MLNKCEFGKAVLRDFSISPFIQVDRSWSRMPEIAARKHCKYGRWVNFASIQIEFLILNGKDILNSIQNGT